MPVFCKSIMDIEQESIEGLLWCAANRDPFSLLHVFVGNLATILTILLGEDLLIF